METVLEAQIKQLFEGAIDKLISEDLNDIKLYYVRPNGVIEYIKSLSHTHDGFDSDTNGVSWDYCEYFNINGKRYCLAGDGYYHNFATLSIA
jgi:hypothetical protein